MKKIAESDYMRDVILIAGVDGRRFVQNTLQ